MTQTDQDLPDQHAPGAFKDPRVGEILDIIAGETGVDRALLTPDATIDALGITSLDMTQAIFALETHFDFELPVVPERAGAEFTAVGDLVAHVLAALDRDREIEPETKAPAARTAD